MTTKRGGGSKVPKNLTTLFMDDPLAVHKKGYASQKRGLMAKIAITSQIHTHYEEVCLKIQAVIFESWSKTISLLFSIT